MKVPFPPIESECATAEEAEGYDRWFRAQVQEAIDDPRPSVPHDQVMARMRAIIAAKPRTAKP
ncbi:antitoxin [Duganella sp. sic0402]|uniref:type II toxin-antitoxin system RelB family antitoxin n=1 Tax=Duganella sp. sic0402 TaxID=2854786 RepID=UPI001E568164